MRTPSPHTYRVALILTALFLIALGNFSFAGSQPAFVRDKLVQTEKIWPGQRLTLYVTLYTTTSFSGSTRFELPKVSGMLIMENEDRPLLGSEKIDGLSYIFKRHEIDLFPLRSGSLTMPAFTVEFGFRGENGKVVDQSFTTRQLQFSVLEIPGANPRKPVITTADFQVQDQWNPEPGKAKVGDAFTRTITLTAEDLPGMAFPPLDLEKIDGLGLYTRQPQVEDQMQRGEFTGRRTETITYVCEQKGTFTIPEASVQWWNPKFETLQEVSLKAVKFEVVLNPLLEQAGESEYVARESRMFSWWLAGFVILFGGGFVVSWKYRNSITSYLVQWRATRSESEPAYFKRFRDTCRTGDGAAVMGALMKRAGTEAVRGDWSGKRLCRAVRKARRELRGKTGRVQFMAKRLPALNP